MNTRINYLYRDADNYKAHNECVVRGEITSEQKAVIISCLDEGEFFIPRLVGMPERKFDTYDPTSDHPWMELREDGFENTKEEPTVDVTVEEIVERFVQCRDSNWTK